MTCPICLGPAYVNKDGGGIDCGVDNDCILSGETVANNTSQLTAAIHHLQEKKQRDVAKAAYVAAYRAARNRGRTDVELGPMTEKTAKSSFRNWYKVRQD